jgi:hypothetical protein
MKLLRVAAPAVLPQESPVPTSFVGRGVPALGAGSAAVRRVAQDSTPIGRVVTEWKWRNGLTEVSHTAVRIESGGGQISIICLATARSLQCTCETSITANSRKHAT